MKYITKKQKKTGRTGGVPLVSKKGRKLFHPHSRQVRYNKQKKLYIPHRKIAYFYWFKFLQIAITEGRQINWKKYDGWGRENEILSSEFNKWWNRDDRWTKLFGIKKIGDKPKISMTTIRRQIEPHTVNNV